MLTKPVIHMETMRATGRLREADIEGFSDSCYCFQLTLGRKLLEWAHSHEFYEICCVMSGSCVQRINGIERVLTEGSAVLLRPRDVHCFVGQSDGANLMSLSVTCGEMLRFLALYRLDSEPAFLPDAPPDGFSPDFEIPPDERVRIHRLCEATLTAEDHAAYDYMRVILGAMMSGFVENRYRSDGTMPADFVHTLAEMNKLENAAGGVPAFLRISNFSHSQLCRLTKRYLGMSPCEYVTRLRLKHAYFMIAYSDADYETISETVGFRSFSHFCSLIKKQYHETPAKIRRAAKELGRII